MHINCLFFLVCGEIVDKAEVKKLVGDSNVTTIDYPWTTIIYRKTHKYFEIATTGYLVAPHIVITGKILWNYSPEVHFSKSSIIIIIIQYYITYLYLQNGLKMYVEGILLDFLFLPNLDLVLT